MPRVKHTTVEAITESKHACTHESATYRYLIYPNRAVKIQQQFFRYTNWQFESVVSDFLPIVIYIQTSIIICDSIWPLLTTCVHIFFSNLDLIHVCHARALHTYL